MKSNFFGNKPKKKTDTKTGDKTNIKKKKGKNKTAVRKTGRGK